MELPAPTALPMSFASVPAEVDTSLPFKVQAPVAPDIMDETKRAYALAETVDRRQKELQAQADQSLIQDEVKGGANIKTPDGVLALAERVKGKVALPTYTNLLKVHDELKIQAEDAVTNLAKQDQAKLKLLTQQSEVVLSGLTGLMSGYEKTVSEKGVPAALEDFEKRKKAVLTAMKQAKVVPDQIIDQKMSMSPGELQADLEAAKFWQDRMKEAAQRKEIDAKAEAERQRGNLYQRQTQMLEEGGPALSAYNAAVEMYGENSPQAKALLTKMQGGAGTLAKLQGIPEDQITDNEKSLAVGQWIQNPSSLRGLDKTYQQNVIKWAASMGVTPEDVASGQAGRKFDLASAQASGRRAGSMAAVEATMPGLIAEALDASNKVPRGSFVPWNRLMQTADAAISDPALKRLKIANQSVASEFQQVIARGGTNVASLQEAMSLLQTAESPQAYAAALKQVQREIEINVKGAEKVRESFAPKRGPNAKTGEGGVGDFSGDPMAQGQARMESVGGDLNKAKTELDGVEEALKTAKGTAKSILENEAKAWRSGIQNAGKAAPAKRLPGEKLVLKSLDDLKSAVAAGQIKVGDHYTNERGEDRVLKAIPK